MDIGLFIAVCSVLLWAVWPFLVRGRVAKRLFRKNQRVHLALDLVVFSANPWWDGVGNSLQVHGSIWCCVYPGGQKSSMFELQRVKTSCDAVEPSCPWVYNDISSPRPRGNRLFRYLVTVKYNQIHQYMDVEIRRLRAW